MLTPSRVVQLKTALYHEAVKGNYVAPGFQVYANVHGHMVAVPTVGKPCRKMIATYQKEHKLKVTGEFDTATQNSLVPKPKDNKGQLIANHALDLAKLAPRHYTQARPTATNTAAFIRNGTDCSGFAMLCLSVVIPGYGTGFGYTGSLIVEGSRVALNNVLPGDLTFYGPGDSEHVVVELGNGKIVSHGHEGGPLILDRFYRDDYNQTRRYV